MRKLLCLITDTKDNPLFNKGYWENSLFRWLCIIASNQLQLETESPLKSLAPTYTNIFLYSNGNNLNRAKKKSGRSETRHKPNLAGLVHPEHAPVPSFLYALDAGALLFLQSQTEALGAKVRRLLHHGKPKPHFQYSNGCGWDRWLHHCLDAAYKFDS